MSKHYRSDSVPGREKETPATSNESKLRLAAGVLNFMAALVKIARTIFTEGLRPG